jgi:hypothetical protein
MLKMIAGDPPDALLVIGLSFNNLNEFEKKPYDTYIPIREPRLTMDVILASGDASICGKGTEGTKEIFIILLSMDDIKKFRHQPGKYFMEFDKSKYHLPMSICIFSGTTEEEMATQFTDLIGPQTKVTISDRFKN